MGTEFLVPQFNLCYLNVQLVRKNGSSSAAQVTKEAIEENDGFSLISSSTSASLRNQPDTGGHRFKTSVG